MRPRASLGTSPPYPSKTAAWRAEAQSPRRAGLERNQQYSWHRQQHPMDPQDTAPPHPSLFPNSRGDGQELLCGAERAVPRRVQARGARGAQHKVRRPPRERALERHALGGPSGLRGEPQRVGRREREARRSPRVEARERSGQLDPVDQGTVRNSNRIARTPSCKSCGLNVTKRALD